MIFTQISFFGFFLIVFCAYWSLPKGLSRKILLLLASAFFYSMWNWRFLPLLLGITVVDYFAAIFISRSNDPAQRKLLLSVSLTANLGILCVFKYYDFFLGSYLGTLGLIIPLGISFHTFQAMGYSIDVYRKKIPPVTSLLDFTLFITFFPQLVAGPIMRAQDFFSALVRDIKFQSLDFRGLFLLFLAGFFKKAVVADNLAPFVDAFYANPGLHSSGTAWTAVFAYTIQIFCDFSGYTDMAIACAGLLGFTLPANFRHPFFSRNMSAFWTRWHISLSRWFHEFVYIPLGGNRVSKAITIRNILITCGLSGLWHGASLQFVIWGIAHAAALGVQKVFSSTFRIDSSRRLITAAAILFTFLWFSLSMVFFRSHGLANAIEVLSLCFRFVSPGRDLFPWIIYPFFAGLALLHYSTWKFPGWSKARILPAGFFYFFFGVVLAACFMFANLTYRPFIYFQF